MEIRKMTSDSKGRKFIMYESPISMYMSDIQSEIQKQQEEKLMVAVNQSIGFDVNKEELLKALQYDREQYTKGYRDCKIDMLAKIKQAIKEMTTYIEPTTGQWTSGFNNGVNSCIEILDKLIADSEKVNGDKTNI